MSVLIFTERCGQRRNSNGHFLCLINKTALCISKIGKKTMKETIHETIIHKHFGHRAVIHAIPKINRVFSENLSAY